MRTLHNMSPGLLSFQITGSDLTEQYLRKQRHRTVALFYYLFTVSWWSHSLPHVVFPNYRICFNRAVTAETVIRISSSILLPLYYVTLIACIVHHMLFFQITGSDSTKLSAEIIKWRVAPICYHLWKQWQWTVALFCYQCIKAWWSLSPPYVVFQFTESESTTCNSGNSHIEH